MKYLKSLVLLSSLAVTACNSAGVKPETNTTPVAAGQQAPGAQPPQQPAASAQAIEQLEGRITAVQDHLLQLKAQTSELQLQHNAVLQMLDNLKRSFEDMQAAAIDSSAAEADQAADPTEMNAVLDQITMMANELSTQVQDGPFRVVTAYTAKGQWVLIRFHRYTGESWLADQNQWHALEEVSTPGTAEYDVVLLRADKDVKGYVVARINRISGETWWLKQNTWQSFIP